MNKIAELSSQHRTNSTSTIEEITNEMPEILIIEIRLKAERLSQ